MQDFTDQRYFRSRRLRRRYGGRLNPSSLAIETCTSERQNLGLDLVRDHRIEPQIGS